MAICGLWYKVIFINMEKKLSESKINAIVENVITEALHNTIQLQLINDTFYPVDSISRGILEKELNRDSIPKIDFDIFSPKLVKRGYKMRISNY